MSDKDSKLTADKNKSGVSGGTNPVLSGGSIADKLNFIKSKTKDEVEEYDDIDEDFEVDDDNE
jgi:hypothetical protein